MYNVGDCVIVKDLIGFVTATSGDNTLTLLCDDGKERTLIVSDPSTTGCVASNVAIARLIYERLLKRVR